MSDNEEAGSSGQSTDALSRRTLIRKSAEVIGSGAAALATRSAFRATVYGTGSIRCPNHRRPEIPGVHSNHAGCFGTGSQNASSAR